MLKLLICLSVSSVAIIGPEQVSSCLTTRLPPPCTTPNQDIGECVEVRHCDIFINSIKSGRRDNHDFMRESRCGSTSGEPTVCCGKYDNYIVRLTTPQAVEQKPFKKKAPKDMFPQTCGNQTIPLLASRIVGGKVTNIGEFPWMARLRHRRKDGLLSYGCGGFLISDRFILTAAHCIRSMELMQLGPIYQVLLGEHNTETDPDCIKLPPSPICSDDPIWVRTAKAMVHPEYTDKPQYHNDIALIPLKKSVQFSQWVSPICLAREPLQEREMWLAGWGRTETLDSSPVKLKVPVMRESSQICASKYRTELIRILHSQICAGGEKGQDSCTGDSGGPLMVREGLGPWYAEGIVSFGIGCGEEGWPGVYTNIPSYIPWIRKRMNSYLKKHVYGKSARKAKH